MATTIRPKTDLNANIDALKQDLDTLRKDVGELSHSLRELAANRGREWTGRAKDEIEQAARAAKDKSRETAESLEHAVHDRPLVSLLMAMGAGFAIGKLLDHGKQ